MLTSVIVALVIGVTACGSSSGDGESSSSVPITSADAEVTSTADPYDQPEPRTGSIGVDYPFDFEDADAHSTVTVAGMERSDDDALEGLSGVDIDLVISTDAEMDFAVAVFCSGEISPQDHAVESDDWNVTEDGSVLAVGADETIEGPLTVVVTEHCSGPQFRLSLVSAEAADTPSSDQGPVAWGIPGDALG